MSEDGAKFCYGHGHGDDCLSLMTDDWSKIRRVGDPPPAGRDHWPLAVHLEIGNSLLAAGYSSVAVPRCLSTLNSLLLAVPLSSQLTTNNYLAQRGPDPA